MNHTFNGEFPLKDIFCYLCLPLKIRQGGWEIFSPLYREKREDLRSLSLSPSGGAIQLICSYPTLTPGRGSPPHDLGKY